LRHITCRRSASSISGCVLNVAPVRAWESNVAADVRVTRNPRKSADSVGRAAFDPSEYTRVRVNVQRTVVRPSTLRPRQPPVTVAQELRLHRSSLNGDQRDPPSQ
jgi:hypothetical protein